MTSDHIEQLARDLKSHGVECAFGVVGSGPSLRLVLALESEGIPYYPVAHEAAAALMAGACCRFGITRGVAISIKGPGFINLLPGMLSNLYENRPALTISEAYPPDTPRSRTHKRAEHQLLSSSLVKGFAFLDGEAGTVFSLLNLGEGEVAGPVHLDLAAKPVSGISLVNKPCPPDRAIDEAVLGSIIRSIRSSKRPALVLGCSAWRRLPGINWNKAGVPVCTTAAGKGAVDETGSFAGGVITGEVKELSPEGAVLDKADLIIGIGLRNTEMVLAKPYPAPLILMEFLDGDFHQGFEPVLRLFASDLQFSSERILEELARRSWGDVEIGKRTSRLSEELLTAKWAPAPVFRHLQEALGPEAVLCLDTGLFCIVGETIWQSRSPKTFCGSSVGRFMGTALPTAIGLTIFDPSSPVVCVCGDGGIRPYLAEIKLAVKHRLPLLLVLMSDGRYGTIAAGAPPGAKDHHSLKIHDPQWWRVLAEMGCPARSVSTLPELDKALGEWKFREGPLFLEMNFDHYLYQSMTEKLR
jgi:acetolactate synthase I/II/III large subunit